MSPAIWSAFSEKWVKEPAALAIAVWWWCLRLFLLLFPWSLQYFTVNIAAVLPAASILPAYIQPARPRAVEARRGDVAVYTLLERFWRILLYVTVNTKLHVTKTFVKY